MATNEQTLRQQIASRLGEESSDRVIDCIELTFKPANIEELSQEDMEIAVRLAVVISNAMFLVRIYRQGEVSQE